MTRTLLVTSGLAALLALAAAWWLPVAEVPLLGGLAEQLERLRTPSARMDLVARVPRSGPITFGELFEDDDALDHYESLPELAEALSSLSTEDKVFVFVHSLAEGVRSTRSVSEALSAASRAHLIFLVERPEDHPVP